MAKISKTNFNFRYPVRAKMVRDLKIVTETVGHLDITGVCSFHPQYSDVDSRYRFDIDSITPVESNIKDILTGFDEDDMNDACLRHVASLYHADNLATGYIPDEDTRTGPAAPPTFCNDRTGMVIIFDSLDNILNRN